MDMSANIEKLCTEAIAAKTFPGCVVGYIRDGQTVLSAYGHQRYEDSGSPVELDTIYDVASVTKSVVTGSVAMKLIELGRLNLDDAVTQYIPELATKYRNDVRIRHLLTYTITFELTEGIADIAKHTPDEVFQTLCAAELVAPPGQSYRYTNGPAILLAAVIERASREPLDVLAKRFFFDPLGMATSTLHPELLPRLRIAPTEIDWRGEVRAVVHDEAAWAMMQHGQLAGNAGLFSTAGDLLTFCQMLLDEGRFRSTQLLSPETVHDMHTNQIMIAGECTSFGWELDWSKTFGNVVSAQAFGKTGFTGCVIVIDPVKKAALVHLSNRTYPTRPTTKKLLVQFRRALGQLVFAELPDMSEEFLPFFKPAQIATAQE